MPYLLIISIIFLSFAAKSGSAACDPNDIEAIGMKSGLIYWSQLSSSSSSELHPAHAAISGFSKCWLPDANDTEPWIQVDFSTTLQLVELETQGSPSSEQWVKSFTISYANSSGVFQNLTHDDENIKVFPANTDATKIVKTSLPEEIAVRYLRIHPKTWSDRPALRLEFYGCYSACTSPGPLPFLDSQITSPNQYSSYTARHARLGDSSGWHAQNSQQGLLKIDYLKRTTFTGLKVQGGTPYSSWSPTYTVQYSNDGNIFEKYKEAGSAKTFQGAGGPNTIVERPFSHPIFARFLQITAAPVGSPYPYAALRIEVQGCISTDDWFYPRALGMQDKVILDSQMNASSSKYYTSGAGNGRWDLTTISNVRHGGWIAADEDKSPWFQVDFITNVTVSMLKVQRLSGTADGVTKYTIASSDDGKVFSVHKDGQQTEKVFIATAIQPIFPHIFGRFIRIQPKEWHGVCAMRVEFYGRYEECRNPKELGMANGKISDRQLSAAREVNLKFATYGRLAGKTGWNGGSISDFDSWYQVDFIKHAKVTAIKMEGEESSSFIEEFKLSYSNNEIDFGDYMEVMGTTKIFTGQDHRETMVEHRLSSVIFSRFLRIHPVVTSGPAAMRLELIGCYVDTILLQTIPLGMESGLILDFQLSASSERYYHFSGAASSRFNAQTVPGGRYGGWIAAEGDQNLWLQINFISNVTVTAIVTQGLDIGINHVKQYTVAFNHSELGFQDYTELNNGVATVFNATTNATVKQDLAPYIFAHMIQIKPKTCIGMCALRVEFFGWYEEYSNPDSFGMYNRSLIRDDQIRSSVQTDVDHGAHAARINNTYGWLGLDSGDYLEIDFGRRASITQIMTQGAQDSGTWWTRNFTVAMSNDGVTFVDYQEFGSRKTFYANIDQFSIVVQKPMHVIFARFIRIIVSFFNTKPGLALDFVGSFLDTPKDIELVALGMEDRTILDSQIIASSSSNVLIAGPANARMNSTNNTNVVTGGWIPAEDDSAPWLLVDFISNVTIKEVAIQLLENRSSYVTEYMLDYGITRGSLQSYVDKDSSQRFFVKYNNRSTVRQPLDPAIFTRFIRIKPMACAGTCALRVEFYGNYEECTNPQALGIENGNISDSQLDSSTIPTVARGPERARLNIAAGGAELSDTDPDMWYEVDFLRWTKITGIKTQGADSIFELVQTFTLSYSSDRNTFVDYKEYGQVKHFAGNSEVDTVVEQRLSRVIVSRYLRVHPNLWNGKPVIRMEVMGSYLATDWFDPVALGMENKMILDSQLAVSSQHSISVASNARLNLETLRENIDDNTTKIVRYGGWVAAEDDNQPWFQVDFIANATISAIVTQALDNGTMSSRITEYAVAFGFNVIGSLQNYSINGQVKVFLANYKNNSLVKNDLYPHITARILRIMPRKWVGHCAMRVEFYGQYEECTDPQPLGLESGYISDGQFSSSTEFDILNGAHNARLNLVLVSSVRDGGASLASSDTDKWFQVDFLQWTKITGSKTQGHADDNYWVERFNLHYSSNGIDFTVYKEYGIVKEFRANFDKNTIVEQRLARVLVTRFLRVVSTASNGIPSIRMEFFGSYVDTHWFEPVNLGMEDRLILDSQMLTSSSKYATSTVGNARLNLRVLSDANTGDIVRHGGWIAADDDRHPWLQVDFIINITLTAIATQGLESGNSWLTGYTLSFGDNRQRMQDFSVKGHTKVFSANSDSNTTVKQTVFPNIVARFIRLKPQTWVGNCTVRLEFYGRYEGCSNPQPLGMENGAILDSQLSSSGSDKLNGPHNARLNLTFISGVRGGGVRFTTGSEYWVQVDFLNWAKVTEIRTQGDDGSTSYFMKSFTLLHGNDGFHFRAFKEFGKTKVFRANYEHNRIIVPQRLTRIILTRFLRVLPKTWSSSLGMRMEVFGEYADTDWFEAAPLGMESRLIVESQLAVSSSKDVISGPGMARLNGNATALRRNIITPQITPFNATVNITSNITTVNTTYTRHGGWIAATDDTNPWFQVDFRTNVTVTALVLQGLDSGMAWVTGYTLAYGYERDFLQDYNVDGKVKLFSANYNISSTVRQDLYTYIIARFLRIIPKTWIGSCALRVEFFGRYEGCTHVTPLGMENETILDSQIDASSLNVVGNPAPQARLNLQPASPLMGSWIALTSETEPWLKVDFLAYAKITSIETQGQPDSAAFVDKFTMSYSNNNDDFTQYKEIGIVKEFIANYDQNTVVKQQLTRVIYARFIRLHPTSWESTSAMRTEFIGCYVEPDWFEPWPLGMESSLILDFQLSASSSKFVSSGPTQGRLNREYKFNVNTSEIEGYGGWIAADDDTDPWFQVNFITNVTVTGIATQGVNESELWVTSYQMSYGNLRNSLQDYQINGVVKVFPANIDQNSTVRHNLELPFVGVYIRVKPKTWENGCGMRFEFYGRFEDDNNSIALGMGNGLILDGQISASSRYSATHRAGVGRLSNDPNSGATWPGWQPLTDETNPWFQVDFETFTKVTSIFTLGLDGTAYWTTKFLVSFSNDGRNFQDYVEFGKPKVFIANIDNERLSEQRLTNVIFARYIRVKPTEWNSYVALRIDFNGSYLEYDCIDPIPLGLESYVIGNPQLTGSSEKSEISRARNARLRLEPIDGERDGAWIASADDSNPWLRVDFKSNVTLRGITTQGRFDAAEWVISYEVAHSIDGKHYDTYKEDGNVKVFSANYDSNTTVKHYIDPPIFAQYVRLHPKQWSGACALRAEFHGCYQGCPNPRYLGLASKVISDIQFNSSSTYATSSLYEAFDARLNLTSAGWIALGEDLSPWLEVNFMMATKVQEILSQGRESQSYWVLTYTVSFSTDGKSFQDYFENNKVKVFSGNWDSNTIMRHVLTRVIFSYLIRIHPKTWDSYAGLRLELVGCNFGCMYPKGLGMQAGHIEDHQISASTSWKFKHAPYNGRLHSRASWMPYSSDTSKYLTVDLRDITMLAGISMQGAFEENNFTTGFKISLKNGDNPFNPYQENGVEKIFSGNVDSNTTIEHMFPLIFVADAIRIFPVSWNGTRPAMRLELLGCYEDIDVCDSSPCENNGTCNDYFTTYNFFNCTCTDGYTGRFCETECTDIRPLGMSGGQIKDTQLTASTMYDSEAVPSAARLNNVAVRRSGGWVAGVNDGNQWFQVDFLVNATVASVLTQGRDNYSHWVETYQVSYSDDGISFSDYKQGGVVKVFAGNSDRDTVVKNTLYPRLFTRFIRIHPKSCSGNCSLRAEFLGCYQVIPSRCLNPIPLGMENKQIKDSQITASSECNDAKFVGRCAAANGRANGTIFSHHGAWIAMAQDPDMWFEVDFKYNTTVREILTQGRPDYDQWVRYYNVTYKNETGVSQIYGLGDGVRSKAFEGNSDRNTVVSHTLSPMVRLQIIRITPVECHGACAMRAEFVGCYEDADVCDPSLCQNNATCNDHFDFFNSFNCTCLPGYTGELCETEIDECLSYPCLNNGTCNDFVNLYNCTCTIDFWGTNCEFEFIWPIANFSVTPIPAQRFGENISVVWEMDQGSYVTVEVYYNEILCCNKSATNHVGGHTSQCNCLVTDPARFDPDGLVDFRIYAYNSVSNETVNLNVEVLKIIKNVKISTKTSFASWGIGVDGTGSQRNVFPAEYPVKTSATFDGGPASIVEWTFSCSVSPTIPDESELSFDKTFPSDIAQICVINVNLKNNISTDDDVKTIDLKESIIFTSLTYDGPLKPNQTMTFTISFEKFGQGTCVVMDLGDNSSLLVFGDASCENKFDVSKINPKIVREPRLRFFPKDPTTSTITIPHEYPGVGTYDVKMSAANLLANVTESLIAVVIPFVCKYPNVTITGLEPNKSNLLEAPQVYRSKLIFVSTENEVFCEPTEIVNVSWTVYRIDDDPAILTTTPKMKASDLGKSEFLTGIIAPDLFIPEKRLPFGFYEISARVEMWGIPYVFGIGTLYVQIIQTPWIIAGATIGSFYTVPYKEPGSLNASASVDPDFNNTDAMSFAWYCRDVEDAEFKLSDLAKEPLVTAPASYPDPDLGGCFGTGRGRLNSNNVIVEFDTNTMVEDKFYVISLFVSTSHQGFAVRKHLKNIYFHVAKGLPPGLVVSCAKNCHSKVSRDEKLILKSKCNARCYGELAFTWTLYRYDDISTPEPFNLSTLYEFTSNQLKEMTTSPIDALEIALKPKSLEPGKKYSLVFRAFRPNGVFGELRYTMITNNAPFNGKWSISPSTGVAMETNFTVSCENWEDEHVPITVEFSHLIKGTKTVFFFRELPNKGKVSATLWLPAGNEESGYIVNGSVALKDRLGAKFQENFTVKVVPQPEETIDLNQLQNLVAGEGNAMAKLFETGNSVLAIGLASNVASTLNSLTDNTTSNDSSSTAQKDTSKQIRTQLIMSLASANLSAKDTSSMEQMSATVLALTKNTEELETQSQGAALQMTETLTSNLKGLSDGDQGFSNVLSGASNLVGGIGQMTTSMAKGASNSSNGTEASDQVKRSMGLVDNIQGVLLDNLVSNEPPVNIESDALSMQVEKVMIKDSVNKTNAVKGAKFGSPSPAALGIEAVVGNLNETISQMQPVDLKIAVSAKNPFSWDNTSDTLSSNVVDIKMQSNMNISTSNVSEDFAITIPRDPVLFPEPGAFFLKPGSENATAKTKEYLKYHRFERKSDFTSINFDMKPEDPGIHFSVYLKKGSKPDIPKGDFQLSFQLPDLSSCLGGNKSVSNTSDDESKSATNATIYVDLKNCTRDPYSVFVSNVDLHGSGRFWFAVQHIRPTEEDGDDANTAQAESRRRRSISCGEEGRRVRRSCVIIPSPPPKPTDPPRSVRFQVPDNLGFDGKYFFPNQTPNYNLSMYESSCLYWDEKNETWTGDGCKVVYGTNKNQIMCKCNHLTSFGSELLVAPNPIDFDSVFNNFGSLAENVAVLALISTILGVYILGVIWARRADRRDLLMVGPTILPKPRGTYHYLITTYTGSRQDSGTTARVAFKMSGDLGDTVPVRLHDRERPCFERQQENMFVVSYPQGIGDLSFVQIWHDNSGSSPSWYLSRIIVKDLQTDKTWSLLCENWLAVESEDGKVCRVLPVANEEEMTSFGHLFSARAIKGLADGHIWFSIVSRPPTSKFTRVQRLSCALCLLCCTMITSAMFYNMGGQGPSPYSINIGSLIIDLKPFVIGLQSSVIIVPVNVLLVQIFRNLRPKKEKDDTDEDLKAKNPNGVKIEDPNEEQPKEKLPYWFIYIAYAICYLASAASIFFTLLYSIQWGKETSTEWVIAMVTSFLQSALLLQPVKVVLLAVVFALFIRKPADKDNESNGITLAKEDKTFEERTKIKEPIPQTTVPIEGKSKKFLRPPGAAKLKKARIKRLKELKMNAALKEICAFFFFLICLMDVAQYHRDPNTYLLTKTLRETFVDVDSFSIPLFMTVDGDSLWMWARETLIPGLYSTEWYNGKKIEKGYLANMEDYLVGVPRVRLLRVKEGSCTVSSYFKDSIPVCLAAYSVTNEDDGAYEVGWKPLHGSSSRKRRRTPGPESEEDWLKMVEEKELTENSGGVYRRKRAIDPIQSGRNRRRKNRLLSSERPKTYVVQSNALLGDGQVLSCLERWRHKSMMEIRGFPYWGQIAMYGGGGYTANLGYDQMTAYTVVADLHSNNWITRQTRAVFVEFTVYNANTNLFGIISLFVEFPSSSGAVTKVQIQASRFYLQLDGGQTLAHILVIFFMLYFLYREGKLVYKQRWAYFKGFWNWIETILVVSEFFLIILFLARLYEVDRNLLELRENPNDYVGFQYAGQADTAMTSVIGILVFFYILRFLRLLRFNKNFLVLGTTLSRISKPIISFFIPFTFAFLAFGLFAFSVFGTELEDYSTFVRTMVTQFSMTLGDFDFEALISVSPAFGTIYFFGFIALNVIVLMNVFVAIINDSYAEVQEETAEMENEFELVDYVVAKIVEKTTKKKPKPKRKRRKKKPPQRLEKAKLIGTNACTAEIDSKCEVFDKLLDDIEKGLEGDTQIDTKFCSVPKEKRETYFRLMCLMESDLIETCESPFTESDLYNEYVKMMFLEK